MDYGIDVSHYNAIADAHAVRGNGITFAWVKASEGIDYVDPSFANKVAQLKAAGITVGAYHFLTAGNAVAQAQHFRAVAGSAGCLATGALMPMADMETATLRTGANPAVAQFYDALAVKPLDVYGNLDWWQHVLVPAQWAQRSILGHIARYNGQPGSPGWSYGQLACHQHTSTGTVPGIPGNVDRDCTMAAYSLAKITIGQVTPIVTPREAPKPAAPAPATTWTVRGGDTLSRIASAWHVTVSALAVANHIADIDLIRVGQVIHRPGSASAVPAPQRRSSYTVRPGDTLSAIAANHRTTVPALVALNHISNPDRIYAGQHILV